MNLKLDILVLIIVFFVFTYSFKDFQYPPVIYNRFSVFLKFVSAKLMKFLLLCLDFLSNSQNRTIILFGKDIHIKVQHSLWVEFNS